MSAPTPLDGPDHEFDSFDCPQCVAKNKRIDELEEQNRRLSEAWKQLTARTGTTSEPGQYITKHVARGYELAEMPHGPEAGYDDTEGADERA